MFKATVTNERLSGTNFMKGNVIEIYHMDEVSRIKDLTYDEANHMRAITKGSNTFVLVSNNKYDDKSFRQIFQSEYNKI